MKFNKINNIVGWLTGATAFIVYLKTMEPTVSFWDCGEFISCAYKLEGGHAPGFPTLMMLQRLFALFAGGGAATGQPSYSGLGQVGAATCINALTAVMSAFAILFLFWTISYFAKRMVAPGTAEPEKNQTIIIMGAALVGALAYTFSDTFWFSAVEAIPFGTSPFFTAFTFWAILKWEREADSKQADRWLVLISLIIGLAVGVHLLILLVIPPIAMVYYFRRYNGTLLGAMAAFGISIVILAFIMFGIIRYIPKFAAIFDIFFTNSLGTPFDVGAITLLLLVVAGLFTLLVVAKKKNIYVLHLATMCTMFIILGYSTYFSAIIRARAGVPVNMTNPSNPSSFLDYVDREQFGQQPIFFGPYFTSQYSDLDTSEKLYAQTTVNGKDRYEIVGKKQEPIYTGDQLHFFPRIYEGNEASHVNFYRNFLGLAKGDEPTAADNFKYFMGYQMNWMWFRFFMWSYAGRQNDMEGQCDPQRGNWISGISLIDNNIRGLGDTDKMGSGYSELGHNKLYCLPLILGIIGLVFQFNNKSKDGLIVLTLFFFTGIAIAIFLNMPPLQPRERDYAFAGCTYTFAIWIGLGVLMVHQLFAKMMKDPVAALGSIALCFLAVPMLMAKEEWKDHDRSRKTLANAVAYNTLSCCAQNAVLFTFGDNQTYPLWYLQEVEGFRKDVRIINTSLLGIDWYIDELNYKINDADAVPMIWKREDYIGDRHNYIQYFNNPALKIPKDQYFNLTDICNFMDDPSKRLPRSNGDLVNYMPIKNYFVPTLTKAQLVEMGMVPAADTSRVSTEIKWSYPKTTAFKSDLAVLNIIAAVANAGWKRPLYFDAGLRQGDYAGSGDYFHMEGDVYRLMPFRYTDSVKMNSQVLGSMNTGKSYDLFMNKFKWGGGERNDVYYDEPNRREFYTYRMDAAFLANALVNEGRKDSAVQVLDKVMTNITEHSYYYDISAYYLAAAYYHAGAQAKGRALALKILRNGLADLRWITTLSEDSRASMAGDVNQQFDIMRSLAGTAYQTGDSVTVKQISDSLQSLPQEIKTMINSRGRQQQSEGDEE